jgi:hypothetical protein
MDDERQRPSGASGSICAVTENKIGEDPRQLDLWPAPQPTNNACEADKTRPTPVPGQGIEPKVLPIEPSITVLHAASSRDHAIRAPRGDELMVSAPSAGTQWFHPALVTGALSVALGVGWIGGSSSSRLFAPAPASTSVQQANSSETVRATAKSDREVMARAPKTGKIAGPGITGVDRGHESSRGVQDRAKILPRPIAMPETRPITIEGWTIREVVGGTVVLEGPASVWRATQGDTVPGIGRIDSIVRWGSRWIVATTEGLISTQN